jgi:hypothetical protein
MLSFRKWVVENYVDKESAIGDFARDVKTDINFTRSRTLKGLKRYLSEMGACENAVKAAEAAWVLYERTVNSIK